MSRLPEALTPDCGNFDCCTACAEPVKANTYGRWFITMGHPGFNSPANNGLGYRSRWTAIASYRRYAAKTGGAA